MRKLLIAGASAALLWLAAALPAAAQSQPMGAYTSCWNGATNSWQPCSGYFNNVAGSTIARPADTTAYTANTTVCAAKTVTACVAGTFQVGIAPQGKGVITRMTLLKSGAAKTSASFAIWLYSAAPTLTSPTQFDNTAYSGPRAADVPNYIGEALCTTPTATSDTSAQVWYECTLQNPNTAGALYFQAQSGATTISYLMSVTAAYTPASGETFTPYVSGMY